MPYPKAETPQNHYTWASARLTAIRELSPSIASQAVRHFANVWSMCPPLDEHEHTNQIAEALTLLVRS